MADPLSIASGIAGLLSLGIQVTQSLVEFYTTYKNQDNDVAKVTQNLDNLQNLFRALDAAVEERRTQANTQDLLQEIEKAVLKCEEIIIELRSECDRFNKDSNVGLKDLIKVTGRRAAYPFRKSTLQKLEEDVGEIRENLSFGLNVLQLKSQTQIQADLSDIKSLVERTNASQISFTIRCWLMAPDASLNHNTACAKSHPKTGLWFVNGYQFRTWLKEPSSFLWLNGFAGCGKSVLCSTTIQNTFHEMKDEHAVGIAFFYFSFTDQTKQDDNGMLRTLLLQLSAQLPDGEKDLEQLYMLNKSGSPSVDKLLALLRSFLERFRDTYILLDALDESPRDCQREGVLKAIQVIRDWLMPGVHLLVTSRNELDIRESLKPSCSQDVPLRNPEVDRDIADFVSYQLENDAKVQKWKSRHEEIKNKMATDAQGVFRYVECQFNAFRRVRNRNQLDHCLRTLPRDLDETYERILCSIADEYVEDVRRVLTLLCFSTRPLTINELIDAHAVDLNDPPQLDRDGRLYEQDDIIDVCVGLVEVVATENYEGRTTPTVRIAHFSVQEYLLSDRLIQQKSRMFAMKSAPANSEIAQICLVYLLEPTLSEGVFDEGKLTEFPFASFAASYWFHHYKNSEEEEAIGNLASKLFKDKTKAFVSWVRLHNMDVGKIRGSYGPAVDIATPVYYAALLGLDFVLNSILPAGSELSETVNIQGGYWGYALQAASFNGHEKAVQILLDRGADINIQYGNWGNALHAASFNGHEKVVQVLLDGGADVNIQHEYWGNILQAASLNGHEKVVQTLLDRGVNVNVQGGNWTNALQAASVSGHEKVVQILLDAGADVNMQDGYWGSALQAASLNGHDKVAQILLNGGADINAEGKYWGNALRAASINGHEKVVEILLNGGADVNTQHEYWGNALYAASLKGHKKVVRILLDEGADVNFEDKNWGNALQAASSEGHENVVQILLDAGADANAQNGELGL
ncbi:NACHT nucleoside triphosphatase [Penicillium malachiteum]|uniref:NACHT nucleoside triphosphatase n=1 Tax=Penicillium malachiteum TaxID=1324776 RepID=UPI0025499602|nr:NACHT nucleoside triphosphatase [Penicillium malachiteum]KAJ5725195.1 NACHT nucleoside triphosphatase [Penicillium malachiteum]